jgi:hypothetical protein
MLVLSARTDCRIKDEAGSPWERTRSDFTSKGNLDNNESGQQRERYLQVMAMNAHRAFSRVFGVAPHLDGAKLCRLVSVPASNIDRQINEHRIDSILKNVPLDSLETFDIRLDALDAIAVLL